MVSRNIENAPENLPDDVAVPDFESIDPKDIFSQIKDLFNKIDKVANEVGQLTGEVSKIAKEAQDATGKINDLTGKVDSTVNNVKKLTDEMGGVLKQIKDIPGEIEKTAEDVFQKAMDALAKDLSKEGLKDFKNIVQAGKDEADRIKESRSGFVDAINQLSIFGNLGPFTLNWSGFYDRADAILTELDKRIDKPPALHRSEILDMINALGPTTVNIGASFNFALVIGSKELGGGGGLGDIPLALFTEMADAIMDRMGIPE